MEEWREVKGSNGYEVSNMGRVRSTRSMARILKPYDNGRGYPVVDLHYGKRRWARVIHKIVAEVFMNSEAFPGFEINHKNNDKYDNRVVNLEYATRSQNMKHAYALGTVNVAKARNSRTFFERGYHGRYIKKPQELVNIK